MSITVRKYKQSDLKAWDNFVNTSSNGTIFHLRSFLSYHSDRQFDDNSLIFEKQGKISLSLKILTGVSSTGWREEMSDGTLKLAVHAIPEAGKANQEMIAFLAREFNVDDEQVKIISGTKANRKEISIKR